MFDKVIGARYVAKDDTEQPVADAATKVLREVWTEQAAEEISQAYAPLYEQKEEAERLRDLNFFHYEQVLAERNIERSANRKLAEQKEELVRVLRSLVDGLSEENYLSPIVGKALSEAEAALEKAGK